MYIPDYYKQVKPGVFEKINPVASSEKQIVDHYKKNTSQHILSDRGHYNRLYEHIKKDPIFKFLPGSYGRVVSVGGGLPKFEGSVLLFDHLTIFDPLAYIYTEHLHDFRALYKIPEDFLIDYQNEPLQPQNFLGFDCVVFCHFLEHMPSFDQVEKWISLQKTDIVIYGPNIKSAKNKNWVHFLAKDFDHNTFFTPEVIKEVGETNGYKVDFIEYSDDFLIWMQKL